MPWCFNLWRSLACGTVSNAFEKSRRMTSCCSLSSMPLVRVLKWQVSVQFHTSGFCGIHVGYLTICCWSISRCVITELQLDDNYVQVICTRLRWVKLVCSSLVCFDRLSCRLVLHPLFANHPVLLLDREMIWKNRVKTGASSKAMQFLQESCRDLVRTSCFVYIKFRKYSLRTPEQVTMMGLIGGCGFSMSLMLSFSSSLVKTEVNCWFNSFAFMPLSEYMTPSHPLRGGGRGNTRWVASPAFDEAPEAFWIYDRVWTNNVGQVVIKGLFTCRPRLLLQLLVSGEVWWWCALLSFVEGPLFPPSESFQGCCDPSLMKSGGWHLRWDMSVLNLSQEMHLEPLSFQGPGPRPWVTSRFAIVHHNIESSLKSYVTHPPPPPVLKSWLRPWAPFHKGLRLIVYTMHINHSPMANRVYLAINRNPFWNGAQMHMSSLNSGRWPRL